MLKGSLFEYWATGGTSSPIVPDMADKWVKDKRYKIGNMKTETIEKVYRAAQSAKKAFITTEYSNDEFSIPINEEYDLVFHPDVIGQIQLKDLDNPIVAITDTKYTGSIAEVWAHRDNKLDFFQALVYTYGFFKWTEKELGKGIHLPFVYQITEHNDFNEPLHKYMLIKTNQANFNEFEALIHKVVSDTEFKANPNNYNCLGKGGQMGACRFIDLCSEGRNITDKTEIIEYGTLN